MNTAEALLLGVPVFGYNAGATPELVSKECGILIESKDNFRTIIEQFKQFDEKQRNRKQIALHIRRKLIQKSV
jgi:glycosyltransferase involved in cell wall biosynthesis